MKQKIKRYLKKFSKGDIFRYYDTDRERYMDSIYIFISLNNKIDREDISSRKGFEAFQYSVLINVKALTADGRWHDWDGCYFPITEKEIEGNMISKIFCRM